MFEKIANSGVLDEHTAAFVIKNVLLALAYCHNLGIVHRDIKPENILLETDSENGFYLKIIDFGCSAEIKHNKLTEYTGTVNQFNIVLLYRA